MVLLRSMLLHPSVFAQLLLQLLVVVCLISFPKPGHSAKCKQRQESEGNKILTDGVEDCGNFLYWRCYASFCITGDFMWNEWGCLQSAENPDEDEGNCVSVGMMPDNTDIPRARFGLPTADRNWTCTCQLGAVYVEMDNTNIVNPNPALRPTTTTTTQATRKDITRNAKRGDGIKFFKDTETKMKCKLHIETEDGELNEKLNTKEEAECEKTMKCGAIFCKANDGALVWNQWLCFPADAKKKACAKEAPNAVNEHRAEWSASTLANATTDWKCRCRFGANGTDMGNAKFLPSSAPVPKTIRHGDGVGMVLMVVGLIIAFWPLFHAASEELLKPWILKDI
ncbi:hypothetical protein niasHT_040020 [Heterodera trifolii]|uniref:Uncharacterized protein n=1 Tax=Heterodera trifolii TaxID=157864 RepID=A0ABD2J6K3_9BILA